MTALSMLVFSRVYISPSSERVYLAPMLMMGGSLTILTNRVQGKHHFYVPVTDLLLIRPWLPAFFFFFLEILLLWDGNTMPPSCGGAQAHCVSDPADKVPAKSSPSINHQPCGQLFWNWILCFPLRYSSAFPESYSQWHYVYSSLA